MPTVLCFGLLLASFPARADELDALYEKGVSCYEKQLYSEAAEAFRELYQLKPDCRIHFNIGQCEFSLRKFGLALESFEAYLKTCSDRIEPERRAYVEEVIGSIEPLVGRVAVDEPETFSIWVDAVLRGATPLSGPLFVMGGQHELVLKRGDQTVFKTHLSVKKGETVTVKRPGGDAPVSPTAPAQARETNKDDQTIFEKPDAKAGETSTVESPLSKAPSEPASIQKSNLKPVGFSIMGGGVAVMAAGVVTGAVALSKRNQLADNCPEKQSCPEDQRSTYNTADSLSRTTTALFAVGGSLAAAGVAIAIIGHTRASTKTDHGKALISAPRIGFGAAGVTVSGRF